MSRLVYQLVVALREKQSSFGYVLMALLLTVVLFSLADFLEQAARFTRTVEIDTMSAEFLERAECGEAAVDGHLRGLLTREAALDDQHAVVTGRQAQVGQHHVQPAGVREKQRRLHLARVGSLADDGLVRPRPGQQRQRAEEDALARAGLAGHRRETRLEIQLDLVEEGQVANAEGLEHFRKHEWTRFNTDSSVATFWEEVS